MNSKRETELMLKARSYRALDRLRPRCRPFSCLFAAMLALVFLTFSVFGDDDGGVDNVDDNDADSVEIITDFGSLFDSEDMIEEVEEEDLSENMEKIFLVNEQVVIGGRYSFATTSSWVWDAASFDLLNPVSSRLDYGALGQISLDARPDEDFRLMIKLGFSYPVEEVVSGTAESIAEGENTLTNGGEGGESADTGEGLRSFADTVSVLEMFSDFDWEDLLFFRIGKHTIKWGVARYFSPADILNLTPIDPEDPDADREGPISLKIHYPFDIHNAYLYVIANNIESPHHIAWAPKIEFVLGNAEFGLGGFYRPDMAPRMMTTATFTLLDFDWYAEGVMSWGTEKTFVNSDLTTYNKDGPLFSVTAGTSYSWKDELGNINVSLSGQLYFNGEGYADPSLVAQHKVQPLVIKGDLSKADLKRPDVLYAIAKAGLNDIYGCGVSLNVSWLGGIMGATGKITPLLSWAPSTDFTYSLSAPFTYGEKGSEYAPTGPVISPKLDMVLFGGPRLSLWTTLDYTDQGTLEKTPFFVSLSLGGGIF